MDYPQAGTRLVLVHDRSKFRLDPVVAEEAHRRLEASGLPSWAVEVLSDRLSSITSGESKGFLFHMISVGQFATVQEQLFEFAHKKRLAVLVWGRLFEFVGSDSNEICASRAELAARFECDPRDITKIMSLLVRMRAVRAEKKGRVVRYSINENIGTQLTGLARVKAQVAAGPLLLLMEGGAK